jgi:HAD superfamily hydrolase (TIGR01549 family)
MPRYALFDLDNTLVDREAAFRCWAEWFVRERSMDAEVVEWLCTADNDGFAQRHDLLATAREQFGLKESVEEMEAAYWVDYISFYRPDPDVTAALRRLRASGWSIAVVTNGPSTQHEKVKRAGLSELVDACCVSHEIGVDKPDARIFEEALRRCGRSPRDDAPAWMVGDSPGPDIKGGHEAGLRTAWVHRGRRWVEPDYHPDAQVGSVYDAVEVLLAE